MILGESTRTIFVRIICAVHNNNTNNNKNNMRLNERLNMRLNGRLLNMRLLNGECEAEYEADCVTKYEAKWDTE